MTRFAEQCCIHDAARQSALERTARLIAASGVELVRFAWCDMHGMLRGKTLVASAAIQAMMTGVGMVSTLLLKDSSDRTAYKVFDADGAMDVPGFEFAGNVMLLADPASYQQLHWASKTGWVQCQAWHMNSNGAGTPVAFDTRRVLQNALARLSKAGYGMTCGLEVEFHIYKIRGDAANNQLDPLQASWPGPAPDVALIHPGFHMLSEQWADMADEPLRIVQRTAQALGLPLLSLEIELGPSQVEAVFEATDALKAAGNMVLFRSAVKQALRRAGYHATFMCRPPFPGIMSSGWHLHQSLTDLKTGANAFMRDAPDAGCTPQHAGYTLSEVGQYYLAGLLAHAHAASPFCTSTVNGYDRFRPQSLAPQSAVWGRDNRGAMLRVIGGSNDAATRIENRIGEPAANPYLYMASQIHAGLDGLQNRMHPPLATVAPYAIAESPLPGSLGKALEMLNNDFAFCAEFGTDFIRYFTRIKASEVARYEISEDKDEWQRREYFSRI
jgi:glutamine synthetase